MKLIFVYNTGTLLNETKHGIWTSTEEKGKVRKVIDYSKNPVPKYNYAIRFNYPALAKENGILSFVNLEINTDHHCNIKSIIVKDSFGMAVKKKFLSLQKNWSNTWKNFK